MSSLFDGVRQEPVSIRGVPGKSPMFFRDFHLMGGVFLADLSRARAALPPRARRPLRVSWNRALVAVHCMEYKDSDIGPYNEISLSIALDHGWFSLLRNTYHAYVKALPVTTEVALHGGIDFFNYPKVLADIRFRETPSHRVCTLRDISGEVVCEFEGRRLATRPDQGVMTLHTYPEMNGRTVRAELRVDRLESATAALRGAGLRLGPRPGAFGELGLSPLVQYLYAPRCQGVLFKPEAL